MNKSDHFTGKFRLTNGRELFGVLQVCGEASTLILFDDFHSFIPVPEAYSYVVGELHDGRLVTLIQCILLSSNIQNIRSDKQKSSVQLFPHYVMIGPSHISDSTPCISEISFGMRDASALFYDFDAFSTVINTQPFVPLIKKDVAHIRQIEVGKHPIISYFTGKLDIAVVDTALGEVIAHHSPSFSSGGLQGVRIDNKVMVTLKPSTSITFQEAIKRLNTLMRFFELVLGREQPLIVLNIQLGNQSKSFSKIEVFRSLASNVEELEQYRDLGPRDALLSLVDSVNQYSTVLVNYLASDNERHDSRQRLQSALNKDRDYTIDRIISAANIFDIFPDSAYPENEELPEELDNAKKQARKLFRSLPDSIERSSILSAIGRIGKLSLKHKIRHRVTSTKLDKRFPQLVKVLEEAVNCRNHYVHGSPGRIDYAENFDLVCFFTNALEFSFAVSDLIDIGWDIACLNGGGSHPFYKFTTGYYKNLKYFHELMSQSD